MDNFLLGFLCAALPLAFVFGLLYLARRSKRDAATASPTSALELRVIRLERDNLELIRRVVAVERRLSAEGIEPGTAPEERTPPAEVLLPTEPATAEDVAPPAEPTLPTHLPTPVAPPAVASAPAGPFGIRAETPSSDAPAPPPSDFSWEQWIGVRGAAAAGSLLLMLAGIYFFQYSVEHGLIPPAVRVAIGALVGLGCIGVSELRLRTRYETLPNFLAGAGSGILYLATWAGISLYQLYPAGLAFVFMVAITGATCALSVRRDSLAIAILGMLGGFATPVLLSTGSDRPIALFGYLLLLSTALLFVARQRGWPVLGLLSLVGTALYQLVWIGDRMDSPRRWIGMSVLALFTLLFTLLARPRSDAPEAEASLFRRTRLAAAVLPFFLTLFFTLRSDLGANLLPTTLLLVLLTLMSAWLTRREGPPTLSVATSSVVLAVLVGYVANQDLGTSFVVLSAFLTLAALSLALTAFAELDLRRPGPTASREGPVPLGYGADVLAVGGLVILAFSALVSDRLAGSAAIGSAFALVMPLFVTARHPGRLRQHSVAAGSFTLALAAIGAAHLSDEGFPSHALFIGCLVAAGVLLLVPALFGTPDVRRAASRGAALGAVLLLPLPVFLGNVPVELPLTLYLGAVVALYALCALATARLTTGGYWLAAVVYGGFTHLAFVSEARGSASSPALATAIAFLLLAAALASSPLWLGQGARGSLSTWRAAALAPVSVFAVVLSAYTERFGDSTRGVVAIALAAIACVTASLVRRLPPTALALRRSAFVWSAVVALGFITLAVPLQLDDEWVTLAWALQGAAVLLLWRRVEHAGLKYYAASLLTVVTMRLTLNPALLDYHPASGLPIVNWLAYTYLVPMACLLVGAWALSALEIPRYTPAESRLLPPRVPLLASMLAVFGVIVGFAWINVTLADAFSAGRELELWVDRRPAHDLTQSLAWALYALGLLAVGVLRTSVGLRSLSLGLMLLTSAKVFLYDLGNLEELYRVASVVGLALSLIGISLAYQRFVFRTPPTPRS